ncbi:MAG: ATP-grasp domain-containing protein [bacterium]|nr:ATP-grasp domain-containing protein [bacterium]
MIKVLLSGVGRRVELVNFFKENGFYVISLDIDLTAPALYFSNKFYKNFKFNDPYFISNIVDIINKEGIDIAFSLIDPELPIFSENKDILKNVFRFFPDYNVVNITYNKLLFFEVFSKLIKNNIIPTLNSSALFSENSNELNSFIQEVIDDDFLIIKPIWGSSSLNVFKLKNVFKYFNNLEKAISYFKNIISILDLDYRSFIIQKYINFNEEITVDIFFDTGADLVELCQRKRLKVRAGEVERAVTVKYNFLTNFILYLSRLLKDNNFKFIGPVNFQFLIKDEENFYLSEVNTRFGGGYPLSYYANANFFEHIRNITLGKSISYPLDSRYQQNLFLLRYDSSFIIEKII